MSKLQLCQLFNFPAFCILLATFLLVACGGRAAAEQPETALELLKSSIKEMQRQDSLLAGYCYKKTVIVEHLDAELSTKKKEERLVEVISVPRGPDIEVLVEVDGKPISEKEKKKREEEQRKRQAEGTTQPRLRAEDLVTQFEWEFEGNGEVNGRDATVLRFRPKPGAVYDGHDVNAEKFMRNVCGRVWVDNAERAISRIEFRSTAPIKSLGGVLWTLHTFNVIEERKRLDGGLWIDSSGEYFFDATALLVKKIRRRSTMRTHDYAKCEPQEVSGKSQN